MTNLNDILKITFIELKDKDIAHIRNCVTAQTALQICMNSLETGEIHGSEILSLWVKKLLKPFEGEFSSPECIAFMKCLKDTCKQLVDTPASGNRMEALDLSSWLSDSMAFLKWIHPLIRKFNAVAACSVLAFMLDTVLRFLNYYRKCYSKDDADDHIQNTIELYKLVLTVLVDNVDAVNVDKSDEFISLTKLIVALCQVGEQRSEIDIKSVVETWKCVAKIMTQCAKSPHCPRANDSNKLPIEWMQRPIKYWLFEISKSTQFVYMEETQKYSIQHIEKYLRLTNFFVKLLQRLAFDFKHAKFPASFDFSEVLFIMESMPAFLRDTHTAEAVYKFVRSGTDDVFRMTYQSPDIHQQLLRHLRLHKTETCTALVIKFLRFSVADADLDYIDSSIETFHLIFVLLVKGAFVSSCTYNEIVELYAALTILSQNGRLKMHLTRNVLNGDLCTALSSTDVLLIVSRYASAKSSRTELLNDLRFWRRCNELFTPFSSNPNGLLVERLLRNAFELCSLCDEIENDELWNKLHTQQQLAITNYRFYNAVGLASACCFDNKLHAEITKELGELVHNFNVAGCTTNGYYKMVAYINLLSTAGVVPNTMTLKPTMGLLENLLKHPTAIVDQFGLLLDATFSLAAAFISHLDVLMVESIAQLMEKNVHHFKEIPFVSSIKFLTLSNSSKTVGLPRGVASKVLNLLEATKHGELVRLVISSNCAPKFKQGKSNPNLFEQLIAIASSLVVCKESKCLGRTRGLKRMRIDTAGDIDLKSFLNDLEQKSKKIATLSDQLDSEDVRSLISVIKHLNIAISKQK